MEEIPPLFKTIGAYFALFGTIYAGFNATEGLLKPETKKRIGLWLGRPEAEKKLFDQEWSGSFNEFFDTLFVPSERRAWKFPLPGFCAHHYIL
jgi:hypothetical protein